MIEGSTTPRSRVLRGLVGLLGLTLLAMLAWLGFQIAAWPDVAALGTEPPRSTAFMDRYQDRQRTAGEDTTISWQWVAWSEISPHLKRAIVAAEDMEFFSHTGFSTSEIRAAVQQALEERRAPRGASTITQQLAKNLWLSPSRSPFRKAKEVLLTRQLERHLSKQRILEVYLNVVEFGPGIYGAQAAARRYFGKSAAGLTEHEAAQLAASLPRPSTWHPGRENAAYRRYVADIEGRMARATFLWRRIGVTPPPSVAVDSAAAAALDSLVNAGRIGIDSVSDTENRIDTADSTTPAPEPPDSLD